MIRTYTQRALAQAWLNRFRGHLPAFACILGFTQTGLIPGISAAGATPADRQYTAIADAEFLLNGPQPQPRYPLPPLTAGASPVLISHAVVSGLGLPVYLFNAGLPIPPAVSAIDLGGEPARCLSTGAALNLATVHHLLTQGLVWGETLADQHPYLLLGECVVGGTTTALAILTGLGYAAATKVNSSHPICNHAQKWEIVQQGLGRSPLKPSHPAPLDLVAAVGDPMQIVVAGMTIAASRKVGVLLAGGTQMLAVYALARAIACTEQLVWQPEAVVVGTTRWVAEDPTGDTVGLAEETDIPLLGSQLSFVRSRFPQLQAYEQGYVKEGVGAGGCAIAASLYRGWGQQELLTAIEAVGDRYSQVSAGSGG
uniref:UPF0284 protein Cyan7425_0342 n=1 Tax=Cyanothece sp. (strain PCC 7425 / ATCC 29141) TaxID=395961 RepID=Y342_CYAP4|nr:RecName: Full=UPF0284 protein Cyan7425_0342 [Cyanothece sp. PCC 7425]